MAPWAPLGELGDLSSWRLETTDVTEFGVVPIGYGARATVEALRVVESVGHVDSADRLGPEGRGGAVHAVVPTAQDTRRRRNVTASVETAAQ